MVQFKDYSCGSLPRYVILIVPSINTQVQLWAFDSTLTALDIQFKSTIENLVKFKPILGRLGSASDGVEMGIEIGKTVSEVKHP